MADFELVTADDEVSSVDQAEFIDLRTVRVQIRDIVTELTEDRAEREAVIAEIDNLNYDLGRIQTQRAALVEKRVELNTKISENVALVTDLREMAKDLKLAALEI